MSATVIHRSTKIIKPGTEFGRLSVLKLRGFSLNRHALYDCKCACGRIVVIDGCYLRSGDTASCGCKRADLFRGPKDITGQVRGTVRAVKCVGKNKHDNYLWIFVCECGREHTNTVAKFMSDQVKCWVCDRATNLTPAESVNQPDAYFSGLFDGEGCVRMALIGSSYKVQISIDCLFKPVLMEFQKRFGGKLTPVQRTPSQASMKRVRKCWAWRLRTQLDQLRFLKAIVPFSMEKKEQIELAVLWLEKRRESTFVSQEETRSNGDVLAAEIKRLKRFEFLQ